MTKYTQDQKNKFKEAMRVVEFFSKSTTTSDYDEDNYKNGKKNYRFSFDKELTDM